jgi:hypothetical protein
MRVSGTLFPALICFLAKDLVDVIKQRTENFMALPKGVGGWTQSCSGFCVRFRYRSLRAPYDPAALADRMRCAGSRP